MPDVRLRVVVFRAAGFLAVVDDVLRAAGFLVVEALDLRVDDAADLRAVDVVFRAVGFFPADDVVFRAVGFFAADEVVFRAAGFLVVDALDLRVDDAVDFRAVDVAFRAVGFFAADEVVFRAAGFLVVDDVVFRAVDVVFRAVGFFAADELDLRVEDVFFAAGLRAVDERLEVPAARVRVVDRFARELEERFAVDVRRFGADFLPDDGSLPRAADTTPPTALPASPTAPPTALPASPTASPTAFPAFPMMSTRCLLACDRQRLLRDASRFRSDLKSVAPVRAFYEPMQVFDSPLRQRFVASRRARIAT